MQISKTLFAAFASLAVASTAPVLAQNPQASQAPAPAVPIQCAPGMASSGMHGGMTQMQQGMGGQNMMQMMQTMQQRHSEMQQMHKEMTQMHQEMLHRHTN